MVLSKNFHRLPQLVKYHCNNNQSDNVDIQSKNCDVDVKDNNDDCVSNSNNNDKQEHEDDENSGKSFCGQQ